MYRKSHVYSKKVVFAPLPFLGYKIVLHLVLGAELLCLHACISYKNTILINLLLAKKKKINVQRFAYTPCPPICIALPFYQHHSPEWKKKIWV